MERLRDVLEAYGADYEETIKRFLGNEGFYLKILDKLPQDQSLKILGDALANEDYSQAFDAAHTLKGVAGNLGLAPLYRAVSAMVEPLRKGERRDDYTELYESVKWEYQKAEEMRARLAQDR